METKSGYGLIISISGNGTVLPFSKKSVQFNVEIPATKISDSNRFEKYLKDIAKEYEKVTRQNGWMPMEKSIEIPNRVKENFGKVKAYGTITYVYEPLTPKCRPILVCIKVNESRKFIGAIKSHGSLKGLGSFCEKKRG